MIHNIEDVIQSTNRHKLFYFSCEKNKTIYAIQELEQIGIKSINIGKQLAVYIDGLQDFSYLNIDVSDYLTKLLDKNKAKINNTGNEVVAIYNLGILFEPALELHETQFLKNFSKIAAIIIIWDNHSEISDRLQWPTQQNNIFLDFTETPLKKLQYAI